MSSIGPLQVNEAIESIEKIFNKEFYNILGGFAQDVLYDRYCYYYALLLKRLFPSGQIFEQIKPSHMLFKFSDLYFDARGIHKLFEYEEKGYFNIDESPQTDDFFRQLGDEDRKIEAIMQYIEEEVRKEFPFLRRPDTNNNNDNRVIGM